MITAKRFYMPFTLTHTHAQILRQRVVVGVAKLDGRARALEIGVGGLNSLIRRL